MIRIKYGRALGLKVSPLGSIPTYMGLPKGGSREMGAGVQGLPRGSSQTGCQ